MSGLNCDTGYWSVVAEITLTLIDVIVKPVFVIGADEITRVIRKYIWILMSVEGSQIGENESFMSYAHDISKQKLALADNLRLLRRLES